MFPQGKEKDWKGEDGERKGKERFPQGNPQAKEERKGRAPPRFPQGQEIKENKTAVRKGSGRNGGERKGKETKGM